MKFDYSTTHPSDETSEYPMRLNKYLAHQGIATRKDADLLIQKGIVFINGERATLGQKVSKDDEVEVRSKKKALKEYAYFAYNKPRGIVSHTAQEEEEDVTSRLPKELQKLGLFPIGRLDKGSHGLMLLTNDGRITDRLLNPDKQHEKEYIVKTKLPLRDSFKQHMEEGVDIEGYITKPTKMKLLGDKSFAITLTEGKKHQIRRMVVAMHNEVIDLRRTRIMNIQVGSLNAGEVRKLTDEELTILFEALGLKHNS